MIKQISEAWEQAKAELAQLRAAVEKTSALAQAKISSDFFGREKDKALRDLGEVVWSHVKGGRLQLPAAMTAAIKAVQEAEKRAQKQNEEINALISEGGEAVDRINAKTIKAKTTKSHKVASSKKKGRKR